MLHALINTSIIWLCSLLVYELLLKGETFHRLNRLYLLLTFIAGIVLPLLPLGSVVYFTSPENGLPGSPVSQAAGQAQMLPPALPSASAAATAYTGWWSILYAAGVAGSLLFLLRDLRRIFLLYRRSAISREGGWIIAETGTAHGPFSLLRMVFVCSKAQYTDEQWRIVLQHEQQHHRSRHFIDLALVQLASLVLWFHPAVYIYRARLRLLHEYEADSLRQHDVVTYGSFLLEQAAFSGTPALTHALSFSPIKNRILMMTKNPSRRLNQCRFLLLLPMMSLFAWCCTTKPKVEIDIKGRYAMLHAAGISYPEASPSDTMTISTDNETADLVIMIEPVPDKLGGQKIAGTDELSASPRCLRPGNEFGIRHILERADIASTLQKMPDGAYLMALSDIIVDRSGNVVYYMLTGPENHAEATHDPAGFSVAKPNGLNDADIEEIQKKISSVLIGKTAFTPMRNKEGEAAPYFLQPGDRQTGFALQTTVTVRNHRISFQNQSL